MVRHERTVHGSIPATESRVRLPKVFMLRMEADRVSGAATAAKCCLLIYTQVGTYKLEIPGEVRDMWTELLK